MSKSRRIFHHVSLFTVFSLIAVSILFSCDNLFTNNTTTYPPVTPSDRIVTLTGTIQIPEEYARLVTSDDSRAALPTVPETNTKYFITATAPGVTGEVPGTVNATDKTFSIPLSLGHVWTITLELKQKAANAPDEDASYTTVLLKTTHNIDLTESYVSSPLTLVLMPQQAGTGKIGLSFATVDGLYDSVSVELLDEAEKTAWNASHPTVDTSGINAVGIASGTYSVTINFFNDEALVYSTTQTINVYDNLTTNHWMDSGSQYSPIDNAAGTFTVTQELIRHFYGTTFCVSSSSGDDNFYGSYYKPLATIDAALSRITQVGTGSEAYTVLILDNLTENVTLGSVLNDKTTSITIKSAPGVTATIDGNASGCVFDIATTVPVSLEKLTITNGNSEDGGGVHTDENTNVTLKNCTVTNNASTMYGGGILIDKSTVTLKNCSVTGNTAMDGGSGICIRLPGATVTIQNSTISGNHASSGCGGIINAGSLSLTNTEITGNSSDDTNSAGGVDCNVESISISGKVIIKDNTAGSATSNLYLPAGKTVTVTGSLSEGSSIGITTQTTPEYRQPVQITSRFGTYNSNITPSDIFKSDKDYAVIASDSGTNAEATLRASGGKINDIFSDDISVEITCPQTTVSKNWGLVVSAEFKKPGTEPGTTVTLSPQPASSELSWKLTLMCGGKPVSGADSFTTSTITIPNTVRIFNGEKYILHTEITYKDFTYDKDIPLTGTDGFVAVTGATVNSAISDSNVFNGSKSITIPDMYVCDHEVTQAEYEAVMGTNPSKFSSNPADGETQAYRPVEQVSMFSTLVYCNKLSRSEGLTPYYTINGSTNPADWGEIPTSNKHPNYATWNAVTCNVNANGYRLPTEAEWEYAARGGSALSADKYSGTNSLDELTNYAWYDANSESKSHEVKKKWPNSLNLYDMSGNVGEWLFDSQLDKWCGGRWYKGANECELTDRGHRGPASCYDDIGFRVVRTASGLTYIGRKAPYETKAVGDIVFFDGSATPYTDGPLTDAQKSAAIAVIFYVGTELNNANDETTVRTLGVGLQQSENELAWTSGNASGINISSVNENDKNGSDNLEQIGQFLAQDGSTDDTGNASKYPAFYYAKNYKNVTGSHVAGTAYETGWYLPSLSELTQVYNAKTTVNAAIALCGGKQFGSDGEDPWYRTSTQNSAAATNCFQINFSNGTTTNYNKKYTYTKPGDYYFGYASAIREF